MATALGIAQLADGTGTDPLTLRRIIQGRWANPGVVCGLEVTGGTGLAYSVSAGCAVTSRAESDGCCEAYFPGGSTPAVSAGDPSNPRIDLVWIRANDPQQGDDDNSVAVGVTSGVASASPVAPEAPAGCLPLATMLVPAAATSTGSAQPSGGRAYAIPYGASMGVLARVGENVDGAVDNSSQLPFAQVRLELPTRRNLTINAYLCVSTPGKDGKTGVATCRFVVDGELYTSRKVEYTENWVTHECTADVQLDAGEHTIGLVMLRQQGEGFVAHYGSIDGDLYVGRTLRVNDNGPAR